MNSNTACIVILTAFLASACATHRAPVFAIAASQESIAAAQAAGADRLAPGEIGLARRKLALTERWMKVRDYDPARWLAEQAEVDAELARARSAAASAIWEASRLERERVRMVSAGSGL